MRCYDCPHYKSGCTSNYCAITSSENFHIQHNCDLVNEDGSLNYDNEYIKMEYGNGEKERE